MTEATPDVSAGTTPTGFAATDAVVARLAALDETPVEQHVAVYEHALGELRQLLD